MGIDKLILFLPLVSGVIIAIIMKNIKIGIGTASFAGAITLFVTSYTQGDWTYFVSYFIGGFLCVIVSGLCFYDTYRIYKRQRDFKGRLGEYISTANEIWRNENKHNNQELETRINEWTKVVAPDLLINKGKYVEELFIDEFRTKARYGEIEKYRQRPSGEIEIQNALKSIIRERIDLLKELIEGIVYRE